MAEQKATTKTKELPPKLVQVDVPEVVPFNEIISTLTLTSTSLEKMISEFFGGIFNDFEGSKIIDMPSQNGNSNLKCKLYFKPCMNKGDGLYAVKIRGEGAISQKKSIYSLTEVVNSINMYAKAKQFELENIAKEILAEFLILGHSDATPVKRYDEETGREVEVNLPKNWNAFTEEIIDPIGSTKFSNPYLAVTLDLLPILGKFYGRKDPKEVAELAARNLTPKNRYQYAANIVKVLNPTTRSYIVEIRKIDIREFDKLSQSIGYGNVSGSIVMTRK